MIARRGDCVGQEGVSPANDNRRFVYLAHAQDTGLRLVDDRGGEKAARCAVIDEYVVLDNDQFAHDGAIIARIRRPQQWNAAY